MLKVNTPENFNSIHYDAHRLKIEGGPGLDMSLQCHQVQLYQRSPSGGHQMLVNESEDDKRRHGKDPLRLK